MKLPLDLLYNLRLLRKNLGFVAICVLMIGMGMGLSITMYTISDNVGTRLLPFSNGDRFVDIYAYDPSPGVAQLIYTDGFIYQSLLSVQNSYEVLGAYTESRIVFSDGEYSERFEGLSILPDLFQATGVVPLMGRGLQTADTGPGAEAVAVISHRLWQSYYAGAQDIIGTVSRINGDPHTIVGVMPEGFVYPSSHDVWMPLELSTALEPGEGISIEGQASTLRMQGVLAEGVRIESAVAEFDSLMQQLSSEFPDVYPNLDGRVQNCCRFINFGSENSPGETLLPTLALALLLLICLNVGNLILVRTNQRIHEFSIRTAVGASRKQLVLAVLQDSLLISLLGTVLGFFLADRGMRYVGTAADEALSIIGGLPYVFNFGWELQTAVTAVLIMLFIWVLSAALAVWQVARQDISMVLAGGKSGATESRGALGTATMVSIEVVFSCFLLVLTGVFIGASVESAKTDYGTATEGYLTARVDLPADVYATDQARASYRRNLATELQARQGIEAVSFTSALPSQGARRFFYRVGNQDLRVNEQYPRKQIVYVSDNYFETMEVSLRAGRSFDATDTTDSLPVVIIDELFAEQLWPNEADPSQAAIGRLVEINSTDDESQWTTLTIVGVTPHIIQGVAMDDVNRTSLYQPLSQRCCFTAGQDLRLNVAVKVAGNPQDYRQTLQVAAAQVDRNVPAAFILSLEEWLEGANSVMVFATEASSGIAFLTLMLAVTGIFAIVSRSVRQRTKEIGIRRAVGSNNNSVLWVFARQGLKYLCLGLIIGGGGAVLTSNAVSTESIRLLEWLPLVFTTVSLGLAILVFLATYSPARVLIAMEPGETLRDE